MNDTALDTRPHAMHDPATEPGPTMTASRRVPRHHQPVKIHTINTTTHSSSSRSSPPNSFLQYSPAPMTAPVTSTTSTFSNIHHFNNSSSNLVGRSRSSSRSTGGVVFTTRPRADSEAARSAMEAMIQRRLDRITERLNEYNSQSYELHVQTQQLAKAFQEKVKRLYLVEDHLLRVQGKPGLSEAYLEHGPQPRRLTNDLEEFRMGVKTLRKKFQGAGSVVSTVEWWKNLKEASARVDNAHALSSTDDHIHLQDTKPLSSSADAANKKDGIALQRIFISPDVPSTSSAAHDWVSSPKNMFAGQEHVGEDAAHRSTGLRSPPLTPKDPLSLSGSFSLTSLSPLSSQKMSTSGGFEDRHFGHSLKSRPLSVIPDLEEPPLFPSSLTQTSVMMVDVPSSSSNHQQQQYSQGYAQAHGITNHSGEPRQVFSPPPPASLTPNSTPNPNPIPNPTSTSEVTADSIMHAGRASEEADAAAAAADADALREPGTAATTTGTRSDFEKQDEEQAQRKHADQDEDEDWEEVDGALMIQQKEEGIYASSAGEETTKTSETLADVMAADSTPSQIGSTELSKEEEGNPTDQAVHSQETEQSRDTLTANNNDDDDNMNNNGTIDEDSWIQILWRWLVRAEYFLLGTAVLAAMMPDNVFALCAGFVSAIIYGILVVHHRLTAPPGTEAPHPPTCAGTAGSDKIKKRLSGSAVPMPSSEALTPASGIASNLASTSSISRRAKALQSMEQ